MVIWEIIWTRPALQDMKRLDRQAAARIEQAVQRLAQIGQGDVRKLWGNEMQWRLRVGGWRVRFVYDYQTTIIRVVRVLPRGRAYRT